MNAHNYNGAVALTVTFRCTKWSDPYNLKKLWNKFHIPTVHINQNSDILVWAIFETPADPSSA